MIRILQECPQKTVIYGNIIIQSVAELWFKSQIREILNDLNKVPKPYITQDTKERIERNLIRSLHKEEEILITYYRNGFIHDEYITVVNIDAPNKTVYYTDAFGLQTRLNFDEFVDIK